MIKKFENFKNNKISSDEVYVSYCYPERDIHEIFLNKDDAQKECDKINEERKVFEFYKNKYKVETLYNAIELIKESTIENIDINNAHKEI